MTPATPYQLATAPDAERRQTWLTIPNPAASADAIVTVPGGSVYRLLVVRGDLATNATAGTRVAVLALDTGSGTTAFVQIPAGQTQAASLTGHYAWVEGVGAGVSQAPSGQDIRAAMPVPDLLLFPGVRVRLIIIGASAGDQWSGALAIVEETVLRGEGSAVRYELGRETRRRELERLFSRG